MCGYRLHIHFFIWIHLIRFSPIQIETNRRLCKTNLINLQIQLVLMTISLGRLTNAHVIWFPFGTKLNFVKQA